MGNIDIIVGTHKLLSKNMEFKDLGLLIIDEEQRFGVGHKETIKDIKKNVDVLTLSATPIPRTLNMSLSGIKDMSVIETPPENRYPVNTYVLEYDEKIIKDAILREIRRGGQVYFVYNRVKDIKEMAYKLNELMPDVRIATAHGQMKEDRIESVMMKFLNKEYDVLVTTTIIETGMDIPNVNTLIVYDADKFGLSQLHQLRGRVGRTNKQAYAYLTYKKDKALSEIAEKRLKAIKDFTEFGAGIKIAMRDLEIRGSGNILGPEQHGHIISLGYDMYYKMLNETIDELKGIEHKEEKDVIIEIKADKYIPKSYINLESERMKIYKSLRNIETIDELYNLEEEIEDRFGDIPVSVRNVLELTFIKIKAQSLSIGSIIQSGDKIIFNFIPEFNFKDGELKLISDEFYDKRNKERLSILSKNDKIALVLNLSGDKNIIKAIKNVVLKLENILLKGTQKFMGNENMEDLK